MREHQYEHVLAAVNSEPWAILRGKLDEIQSLLSLRADGFTLTQEDIRARLGGDPPARRHMSESGSLALVPIFGVICRRANMLSAMSGGTSTEELAANLRAAADDPAISSILLVVDSPGGQVSGITELAAQIRSVKNRKRVVAAIDGLGASASYWLAAQANEISITPSGMAGAIGIISTHTSMAGALEKQGLEVTTISAGQFKAEANPFQKLTPEAKTAMQRLVDQAYATFVQDVAKGRRTTVGDVRGGFGKGRVLAAEDALAAGLVDRIETFDDVIARLQTARGGTTVPVARVAGAAASSAPSSLAAMRAALDLRAKRFALAQRTLR